MKNLLIVLLLIGMGYFGYQAFTHSDAVQTESATERSIRENDLDDIRDTIPMGSQEALKEVNSEVNTFFDDIFQQIKKWRLQINTYIDAKF